MTETEILTQQTINYGSVYESLVGGYLTPDNILMYLLNNEISDKTLVAYRCVCKFSKDQIVNDVPFIISTDHDEYVAIYILSLCNDAELPGRNDQERLEIAKKTQKVWPKLMSVNNGSEFLRRINLICNVGDISLKTLIVNEVSMLVGSRSNKYLSKICPNSLTQYYIDNDYLVMTKFDHGMVTDRCNYLKENANLYWETIGKKLYSDLIKNSDPHKLSRDTLKQYISLFPDLFPAELSDMSDLVYNLRKLPGIIKAYVLGYPIHEYVPSDEVIETCINNLSKDGPDKYCETVYAKNRIRIGSDKLLLNSEHILGNEEDELMEKIWEYNSFDVIRYYIDTHVYYFTRPGFDNLITTKKNPWSGSQIPLSVLSTITGRNEAVLLCKLPKSAIIRDLLDRVEKETLYDVVPSPDEVPPSFAGQILNRPVRSVSHDHGNQNMVSHNPMNQNMVNHNMQRLLNTLDRSAGDGLIIDGIMADWNNLGNLEMLLQNGYILLGHDNYEDMEDMDEDDIEDEYEDEYTTDNDMEDVD